MLSYLLPLLAGALAGAVTAGLLLWRHRRHEPPGAMPTGEPVDPWVEAEIDRAAVAWATDHGRPEAAGLMADKLRLLHHLGAGRGRS
jgi:hypothetical protein